MTEAAFLEACGNGDLAAVRAALDSGMDANASVPYDDGEAQARISALYHACVGNRLEVVTLLLERGADPNDGESVYHAAELNHRDCLELLLAHGADLGGRSESYGNTPLYFLSGHHASSERAATVALGIDWLLEHGADPNVTSGDEKETPLHRVAHNGWSRVARLLLDHGADPSLARADGRTPYVLAVRGGHESMTTLLLESGARAQELAPVDALIGACARGDEAAARGILASHPGLIASFSAEDRAAMAHAAHEGRDRAARTMAAVGFDLSWEGMWGGTPLHHAAWVGNVPLARELIALGAPVNFRDSRFGSSPLGWAAHGSKNCRSDDDAYGAIVQALIDAGSTREASFNRWGEPPEALATERVAALLRK